MRDRVLGVLLLAVAAFVALFPIGEPDLVPQLGGHALPAVLIGPAFAVLLIWAGLVRLLLAGRGARTTIFADLALTAPVTVFLVAMVNGVTDVLALVPLYALSSAAWLLAVLQTRVRVERGHPLLPLCFAAGVGIVPWGVIALVQIALHASYGARLATPVALAAQLLVAVLLWRSFRRDRFALADTVAAVALILTTVAVMFGADLADNVVI